MYALFAENKNHPKFFNRSFPLRLRAAFEGHENLCWHRSAERIGGEAMGGDPAVVRVYVEHLQQSWVTALSMKKELSTNHRELDFFSNDELITSFAVATFKESYLDLTGIVRRINSFLDHRNDHGKEATIPFWHMSLEKNFALERLYKDWLGKEPSTCKTGLSIKSLATYFGILGQRRKFTFSYATKYLRFQYGKFRTKLNK